MSTRQEWNRLINLTHDLALIEADLREEAAHGSASAQAMLWEHFGVQEA